MISGSASGWDVGMYGGWWQISLQAELSDGLEMLAESTAHRLSSILVLSCAGTYGTAAVGCAISGAHGCKWGSGREKGVGCVCVSNGTSARWWGPAKWGGPMLECSRTC